MLARALRAAPRRTYSQRTPTANDGIIDMLTRNMNDEESSPRRDPYKVRSFQRAISAISQLDRELASGSEALKLKGVGRNIAFRIDLFLEGKKYDPAKHDVALERRKHAIAALRKLPGLGATTAQQLYDAGCMSLEQLHEPRYFDLLLPAQKISVVYGERLQKPLARADAEALVAFIREHTSSKFDILITDAYRRGASALPHVSLLFLHPAHIHIPLPPPTARTRARSLLRGNARNPFHAPYQRQPVRAASRLLQDVVRPLEDAGLLAATLAAAPARWAGVALRPRAGGWREVGERLRDIRARRGEYCRLELSMAPWGSRGAALLALTGDVDFWRGMRDRAQRLGMHLNEYGLWRWQTKRGEAAGATPAASAPPRPTATNAGAYEPDFDFNDAEWTEYGSVKTEAQKDAATEKTAESRTERADAEKQEEDGYWELVESESEERILDALGMEYVEPARRNYVFLRGTAPKQK